jgi:Right handed beta helix region
VEHVCYLRPFSRLNLLMSIILLGSATDAPVRPRVERQPTPTRIAISNLTPKFSSLSPTPISISTSTHSQAPTPSPSATLPPTLNPIPPGASGSIGTDNPGGTPHPGTVPGGCVVFNSTDSNATITTTVTADAVGTCFQFNAGTYNGLSITPKTNDGFYGVTGTIFDGNGIPQAFRGQGNGSGVIISGIVFRNYSPALHAVGIFGTDSAVSGWVIRNNEFKTMSVGTVITGGTRMLIQNNYIHDNYWQAIGGYQTTGVIIDHNEIVRNNLANASPVGATAEGSGMKFYQTTNTHVTNNLIDANNGVGVWFDTDNMGSLISNNIIIHNTFTGIMDEISCGNTIFNNTIIGNGLVEGTFIAGGIFVSTSANVQIFNNLLNNNLNGVGAFEESRGSSTTCGTYVTTNLKVHDNYVTMTRGVHGMQSGVQSDATNLFSNNHYCLSGGARFLFNTHVSPGTWVANGQDITGTFDCNYPGL